MMQDTEAFSLYSKLLRNNGLIHRLDEYDLNRIADICKYHRQETIKLTQGIFEANKGDLSGFGVANIDELFIKLDRDRTTEMRELIQTRRAQIILERHARQKEMEQLLSKPQVKKKVTSFNYLGASERLKQLYGDLEKYDLLNGRQSKEDDFVKVLTTSWDTHTSKIFWTCENLQVRYIYDGIESKWKDLSFANIERSQTWVSKQGNNMTGGSFSSSKSKSDAAFNEVKNKQILDRIVSDFME